MLRACLLFFLLLLADHAFAQTQPGRNHTAVARSGPQPAKPIVLAAHDMQVTRWNASELWQHQPLLRDSMARSQSLYFCEYESDLRVFYRLSRKDTVWNEIQTEMPQYYCNEEYIKDFGFCKTIKWGKGGEWSTYVEVEFANWYQGKLPVALIKFGLVMSGNSCSETYEGINVLEITAKPRLLLSALTKHSEGCRGGTDFFTGEYEGSYYGSWRQINLAGPTLRIGKRRAEGEYGGYHITPLTPGRYQYRNGHLVWVGK